MPYDDKINIEVKKLGMTSISEKKKKKLKIINYNIQFIDVICYILCDVKFLLLFHCPTFILHPSVDLIAIYLLYHTKKWNRPQKISATVEHEKATLGHKSKQQWLMEVCYASFCKLILVQGLLPIFVSDMKEINQFR